MIAAMVLQAGEKLNMNIVWTAMSLVLTRCFQVYSNGQAQKSAMQQKMSIALYDKMQDSQEGVVSAIVEVGKRNMCCCMPPCRALFVVLNHAASEHAALHTASIERACYI